MSSFISKNLLFNKDEEKKSESKTIDGSSPLSEKIKSIFKDKNDEDLDEKNTNNGVFDKIKDRKECFVCCSKKLNHIICAFCNAFACNDCNEKYILSTPNPKCMSCNKEWNYEFLRNNFTKSFMNNKYKKYKENILFDIEKYGLIRNYHIIKLQPINSEIITYYESNGYKLINSEFNFMEKQIRAFHINKNKISKTRKIHTVKYQW